MSKLLTGKHFNIWDWSIKNNQNKYSPRTVKLVINTLGGWVETWHIYSPESSFLIAFMWSRQLLGYWNLTWMRESPLYVTLPTVSRDTLSVFFLTHITCNHWEQWFEITKVPHGSIWLLITVLSFSMPTRQFRMASVAKWKPTWRVPDVFDGSSKKGPKWWSWWLLDW